MNRKNYIVNRKIKNNKKKFVIILILLIIAVFGLLKLNHNSKFQVNIKNNTIKNVDLKVLNSKEAILVKLKSGKVISTKNSEKLIYPASLTKIMTAIVVLEHTKNLEKRITMNNDYFKKLYIDHASMAGFKPGENVKKIDLLYGMLLPSGAECCMALTKEISGSEYNFVKLMNYKAKEIGMKNTNFTNVTGLHDKNHYSTVEDISILLEYALNNPEFKKIFTTKVYTTNPTNLSPKGITFYSTTFKNMDGNQVSNGEIIGGKTGYTKEAGLCLASLAHIDGDDYVLVTANASGDHTTKQYNLLDAKKVFNTIK